MVPITDPLLFPLRKVAKDPLSVLLSCFFSLPPSRGRVVWEEEEEEDVFIAPLGDILGSASALGRLAAREAPLETCSGARRERGRAKRVKRREGGKWEIHKLSTRPSRR